jgi:hypothetical protein
VNQNGKKPLPETDIRLKNRAQIAARYEISVRLVDQLKRLGVLPFYKLSKRAIRFDPEECDVAIRRWRVAGIGE